MLELTRSPRADEEPLGGRSHILREPLINDEEPRGAGDAFIESMTPRSRWERSHRVDATRDILYRRGRVSIYLGASRLYLGASRYKRVTSIYIFGRVTT